MHLFLQKLEVWRVCTTSQDSMEILSLKLSPILNHKPPSLSPKSCFYPILPENTSVLIQCFSSLFMGPLSFICFSGHSKPLHIFSDTHLNHTANDFHTCPEDWQTQECSFQILMEAFRFLLLDLDKDKYFQTGKKEKLFSALLQLRNVICHQGKNIFHCPIPLCFPGCFKVLTTAPTFFPHYQWERDHTYSGLTFPFLKIIFYVVIESSFLLWFWQKKWEKG